MTVSHSFEPQSAAQPRFDSLAPIHKAVRLALCDMVARAGQTDFENAAEAAAFRDDLAAVLEFCEHHAKHEDRFVAPALAGHVQGALEVFEQGHPRLERMIAELATLGNAALDAPAGARARVGQILYRHLAAFAAENLAHMAEEERTIVPLLQRLYSDAELMAQHDQIIAAIPQDELAYSMTWILRASNPAERDGMVSAMLQQAPGAAVATLVDAAAASIPDDERARLLARCGRGAA